MVWTCRAQHRLDCRSTQAECGCTEKIRQTKEIMGWSAWEWQKEARYGFCWPSEPFWVERTPSRKTCQKAQSSVEENRALKWIWWWWWYNGACRFFMGGGKYTPNPAVNGDMAWIPPIVRQWKSIGRLRRIIKRVFAWAKAAADNTVKKWAYRVKQKFYSLSLVHFYNVDNIL